VLHGADRQVTYRFYQVNKTWYVGTVDFPMLFELDDFVADNLVNMQRDNMLEPKDATPAQLPQ